MYHSDTKRLLNRAERRARELAEEYDGNMDNLQMWIDSATKAEIDLIARNGETLKQFLDKMGE